MPQTEAIKGIGPARVSEHHVITFTTGFSHHVDIAFQRDIALPVCAQKVRHHSPDASETKDHGCRRCVARLRQLLDVAAAQLDSLCDIVANAGEERRYCEADGCGHLPEISSVGRYQAS